VLEEFIMHWLLLLFLFPSSLAHAADVCNPADLVGPYAFQLMGLTDISGPPRPTVSLGRVVFDGQGGLSGTASAMFRGLLLGNPVTGSYEAQSDCSVIWKLQDDSGGFQNFSGTFSADGDGIQFKQTDPGGAQHGIMKRTSSRERQLPGRQRLLGTARIDAAGPGRGSRRTLDNDDAWISGQRRQGNPRVPDRRGRNGGRTL
jgi:hypothetical protein